MLLERNVGGASMRDSSLSDVLCPLRVCSCCKDEYSRKEELFKRREENLRKKDLELQESLVLFNKFLKENEQKRRRADHRANDEIKKRLKWEKQIQAHKTSVALLREKCERLKQAVAQNEKYHKYLVRNTDTTPIACESSLGPLQSHSSLVSRCGRSLSVSRCVGESPRCLRHSLRRNLFHHHPLPNSQEHQHRDDSPAGVPPAPK